MSGSQPKNVNSTKAENDAQIDRLKTLKSTLYNAKSTIILGIAGTDMVVQEFKIHKELIVEVFNRKLDLPTAGVITTSPKVIRRDAAGVVIVPTPRTEGLLATFDPATGDFNTESKNKINRGFIGRKVRVPLPLAAAAKLKRYFVKTGATGRARKNAWIMFPRQASNMAIANWIATHIDTTYLDDMGVFYSESGTKVSFDPAKYNTVDPAQITKLIGKFTTTYKNRLTGQPAV